MLMADQTDAGKADPQAVSAGKGDVQSGGSGGVSLPPLTLVFECVSSILLKLGRGLVDCVAPCTTVGSQVRPPFVVDVTGADW